ncbi:MAG: hypothetical protein RBR77_00465 [Thauera sp.]|jgi:hypothetical protein|nr:hypothetical protein [Thauera sp.]
MQTPVSVAPDPATVGAQIQRRSAKFSQDLTNAFISKTANIHAHDKENVTNLTQRNILICFRLYFSV